jgi:drug/metabolite transporter (DMT)-like permease
MSRSRIAPRAGALVAVVLWGLSFVATKAALREIPPLTLITTRFAMGAVLLLAIVLARRDAAARVPPRREWGWILLLGLVGVTVHQMLQSYALTMTTAVRTGWLIGLTPIWSAILAVMVLKERLGPVAVAGLALGFAGAVLIVTRGDLGGASWALPSTRGDLLILASTLNWAVCTVISREPVRRMGGLTTIAWSILAGWLLLLPFVLAAHGAEPLARLSPRGWGAVLFLGLGCSGLAYALWYGALEHIEASRISALLYLEPLVTFAAAVALLGEPVGVATVAGWALVLLGVVLVERTPRRAPSPVSTAPDRRQEEAGPEGISDPAPEHLERG